MISGNARGGATAGDGFQNPGLRPDVPLPSTWFLEGKDPVLGSAFFFAALAYLLVPAMIVLVFFAPWPPLVLAAGALAAFWCYSELNQGARSAALPKYGFWPYLLLAAVTAWLSGALPPFAENNDWYKHYAIFNALVDKSWPPMVAADDSVGVLRYYLGYYVIPAAVAKALGGYALPTGIFLWTTLGLFLALTMAFGNRVRQGAEPLLLGCAFLLFSGADIVGRAITAHDFGPPMHFEWWRGFIAINSLITNVFWTPQHAIAGLVSVFMALRNPLLATRNGGLILAAVSIWSPLVAIGLLPVLLCALFHVGVRQSLTLSNLIAAPLLLVPAALFLGEGTGDLPAMFIWQSGAFSVTGWLVFVLLEFGAIALSLLLAEPREKLLILMCTVFLLAMSLVSVGAAGDLLLRGSIPSLAILAALSSKAIVLSPPSIRKAPLIVCLVLGVVTPMGEILRGITSSRIPFSEDISILQAVNHRKELLPQYLVFRGKGDASPMRTVREYSDMHFKTFGVASFDEAARRVQSESYTDAALISQELVLPAGFYRLEARLSWDVQSEDPKQHGGHISLHGQRLLVPIASSRATNRHLSLVFETDGAPFQVAIGLGGWAKGKGFVELKEIKLSAVEGFDG